jgi:hypothetical protein
VNSSPVVVDAQRHVHREQPAVLLRTLLHLLGSRQIGDHRRVRGARERLVELAVADEPAPDQPRVVAVDDPVLGVPHLHPDEAAGARGAADLSVELGTQRCVERAEATVERVRGELGLDRRLGDEFGGADAVVERPSLLDVAEPPAEDDAHGEEQHEADDREADEQAQPPRRSQVGSPSTHNEPFIGTRRHRLESALTPGRAAGRTRAAGERRPGDYL